MAGLPRVVVTGIGMVTPVGLNVHSSWQALIAGTSGNMETMLAHKFVRRKNAIRQSATLDTIALDPPH